MRHILVDMRRIRPRQQLHNPLVPPQYNLLGQVLAEDVYNPAMLEPNTNTPAVMIHEGTRLTYDLIDLLAYWGIEEVFTYQH